MSDNEVVRDERGRWVTAPVGKPITSDNARALARKRWEKYRQAAVDRIVEEARATDTRITGGTGAWGLLVAKQYVALMETDKPRGDDLHRIGQAMGALPTTYDNRTVNDDANGAGIVRDGIAQGVAQALERVMRDVMGRQRDVIDVDGFDNSNYGK